MSTRTSSFTLRAGTTAVATAVLVLVGGAVAQAHVQVIPDQTAAGTEITKLTFRVPTESDTAGTTKVSVSLPTSTPFAEVLAEPLAGWTAAVVVGKLPKPVVVEGTTFTKAPVTVTWTADKGVEVKPGEFQEFSVSAGPIPDTKELAFPVAQTYSDGSVVKWDEPQAPGADEPANPLPEFAVTAAQPDGDTVATPAPGTAQSSTALSSTAQPSTAQSSGGGESAADDSDSLARGLGAAGLVAGLIGLVLGLAAWRRSGATA